MMNLGRRLRMYREQAGYSRAKEFAEKLQIPYTRYVAYENKGVEPKLDVLCKIASTLNISIDELLGVDRFQRCKRMVESTHTMTVIEQNDGTIKVIFSYDKELVSSVMEKVKKFMIDEKKLSNLTKADKIFENKDVFCRQVELADARFRSNEANLEAWERCFDDEYELYQATMEFNKQSCIPLEWWQIKSISSAMWEDLLNQNPEERTPEKIAQKKQFLQKFFANRLPYTYPQTRRRFPVEYERILREVDELKNKYK